MNRHQHLKADQLLLGYTDERVHAFMDKAVKWLGVGHRMHHHGMNILDIVEWMFEKKARKIALLHILIDGKVLDRDFIEAYIKP